MQNYIKQCFFCLFLRAESARGDGLGTTASLLPVIFNAFPFGITSLISTFVFGTLSEHSLDGCLTAFLNCHTPGDKQLPVNARRPLSWKILHNFSTRRLDT